MFVPLIFIEVYILGLVYFKFNFFVEIVLFDSYILHNCLSRNGVVDLKTHKLQ